ESRRPDPHYSLIRLARRFFQRRHFRLGTAAEPQKTAGDYEADGEQLRAAYQPMQHATAFRVVAQKLEKIPGEAVHEHVRADHLSVETLSPKHPGEQEEVP